MGQETCEQRSALTNHKRSHLNSSKSLIQTGTVLTVRNAKLSMGASGYLYFSDWVTGKNTHLTIISKKTHFHESYQKKGETPKTKIALRPISEKNERGEEMEREESLHFFFNTCKIEIRNEWVWLKHSIRKQRSNLVRIGHHEAQVGSLTIQSFGESECCLVGWKSLCELSSQQQQQQQQPRHGHKPNTYRWRSTTDHQPLSHFCL